MAETELPNVHELEEAGSKTFTKRVALATACYAVALAITALGGNNAMKEMLLFQQEASNQWAYYQAKAMRENMYRVQRLSMEANFIERQGTMRAEAREHFQTRINKMAEEEARYASEKKEIEREAKKAEHERDIYKKRDPYFDFAEALLQISVVMASIAILSASMPAFIFSVVFAVLGAVLSLNGYTMLFHLPFFH